MMKWLLGCLLALIATATYAQMMLLQVGTGAQASGGVNYYVDSVGGSDSNNGLTPATAWATFTHVNAQTYNAGDSVLFKAGQTLTSAVKLSLSNSNYSGTPPTAAQPLTISTYGGVGNATFSVGTAQCMQFYQIGALAISNISCTGTGTSPNVQVLIDAGALGSVLPAVSVNNISVTGAATEAFSVGGDSSGSGYNGVTVSNSSFTNNTGSHGTGIEFYMTNGTTPIHSNVTISNNTITGNAANGIELGGVNTGTISNNIVGNNGATLATSAGIQTYESTGITISFNEVYGSSGATDGEGIDLDGGTQNSVVQYNYTHGNSGGGLAAFQVASEGSWANNTFRYNISQNDATDTNFGSFTIGAGSSSSFTGTNKVYNNVFYQGGSTSTAAVAVYPAETSSTISTFTLSNNIFMATSGAFLFNSNNQIATPTLTGNDYCPISGSTCGGTFSITWASTNYSSFSSWQTSTSQEKIAGVNVGLTSWPALVNAGGGGTTNGYNPSLLTAYQLSVGSPMIGEGLTITSPGSQDYYGNVIPSSAGYNVGAYGGFPAVQLNFANNTVSGCTSFASCMTVTRVGNETCTDGSGNITYVTDNTACITSGGLQVFAGATNLQSFSNVDTTNWNHSNGTATANNVNSPDGTTNALHYVIASTASVSHIVATSATPNVSITSGTQYVMSCFVQGGGGSFQFAQLWWPTSAGFSTVPSVNVNLTTGATALPPGSGASSSGAIAYANNWWRAWMVETATSNGTTGNILIDMQNSINANKNGSFTGDGTSSINVWGCQVEAGSFPSPYIPNTTSGTASRNADNIQTAGLLATTLNSATGTVVANTNNALQSQSATIVDSNGTRLLGKTGGNVCSTALGAVLSTANTGTWTGVNDCGLAWDATGGKVDLNNGTAVTDTTARTPSATTFIGSASGTSTFWNGYITNLTVYPSKLSSPQ